MLRKRITKFTQRTLHALSALLLVGLQSIIAPSVAYADSVDSQTKTNDKITICHRTASYSNPYTSISVDKNAADGIAGNSGQTPDHYGEHQGPIFYPAIPQHTEWGDIIPPIDGVHSGLNWTDTGQAIWNNDCKYETGSIKVNKKVDADGNGIYEGSNGTANQLGFDWGYDNNPVNRDMGTSAGGILVGQHTVTESNVSGFNFKGWYPTHDDDYSCSNPKGTTLPISLQVKDDKTTEVTLCNQAAKKGSITIRKDAHPHTGSNEAFSFTSTVPGTPNFQLDDEPGGGVNNIPESIKFTLAAGQYSFTEQDKSGWKLKDIVCSDGASVQINGATVSVSLASEQNVTCTYTNLKRGKIKVYKQTYPNNDPTEFSITASGNGTISGNATRTISDNGQYVVYEVDQGTYSVSEAAKDGWKEYSNTCQGLHITPENLVETCTITNKKLAKLKIIKDAEPESDHQFNFQSNQLGSFSLVDDGTDQNNSKQFTNLTHGEYKIWEQAQTGWDLKNVYCWGTKDWERKGNGVEVDLHSGDDVTCVFSNKQRGTILGHKFNDVNENGAWDQDEKGLAHWHIKLYKCTPPAHDNHVSLFSLPTLDNAVQTMSNCSDLVDDDWTDKKGKYLFDNLYQGKYKVCEDTKDYWTQTYPANQSGCHFVTINQAGQVAEADFGNHHNVSLEITKSNDAPETVFAGSTVTYTITVTVPEDSDTIYDANAVDVLPSGFTYIEGSWSASSSVRGNIKDTPTTEPSYGTGSEGIWQLGTMQSGEVVTLTYRVTIGTAVTPGTYTNTVFSRGFDNPRCGDISEELDQELARFEYEACDPTCSEVVSNFATSDVTVVAVLGESTFTPGQVLGASTLADTGTRLQPMQLIIPVLMLLGVAYLSIASKRTYEWGGK